MVCFVLFFIFIWVLFSRLSAQSTLPRHQFIEHFMKTMVRHSSSDQSSKNRETEEEEPSVSCFHFSNNGHQKRKENRNSQIVINKSVITGLEANQDDSSSIGRESIEYKFESSCFFWRYYTGFRNRPTLKTGTGSDEATNTFQKRSLFFLSKFKLLLLMYILAG